MAVAACRLARPVAMVHADARAAPPPRGFLDALRRAEPVGLIAEIGKTSPSCGDVCADFDPAALARACGRGGAACLSVVTDAQSSQGSDRHLRAVRAAVDLPLLRRDLIIDPYQVIEARSLGADCIPLVMAVLDLPLARELEATARQLGMDVLVEVQHVRELEAATELSTQLLGIRNHDLPAPIETTIELLALLPQGYTVVSEGGVTTRADLDRLIGHGVRCALVGAWLMAQNDVESATRRLLWG